MPLDHATRSCDHALLEKTLSIYNIHIPVGQCTTYELTRVVLNIHVSTIHQLFILPLFTYLNRLCLATGCECVAQPLAVCACRLRLLFGLTWPSCRA
jgi:hypothetical protein